MAKTGIRSLMDMIKLKVEALPPEQSFLKELKATVSAENKPEEPSPYYKPSSMNCLRMVYFMRTQAPFDVSLQEYQSVRISECGTDSHNRLQNYIAKMRANGFDCDYIDPEEYIKQQKLDYLVVREKKGNETKLFDTRYNISFMCDGIIRYKGEYYILEIKTETEEKHIAREGADLTHQRQTIMYSLSLGINKIMWLYEERNFCEPKAFITEVTDEQRTAIILEMETVESAIKILTPPKKTSMKKTCYYCHYKTECAKWP